MSKNVLSLVPPRGLDGRRRWAFAPLAEQSLEDWNKIISVDVEPEEIAGAVLTLASDIGAAITGAIYPVDGGRTAH